MNDECFPLSISAGSIFTEIEDSEAIFQNRNRTEIDFYQSPESSKNRNRKKLYFLTPNLIEIELQNRE